MKVLQRSRYRLRGFLQGSLATIGSIELVLTPLFSFENNSLTKCNKRMEKPILGISSVNVCR